MKNKKLKASTTIELAYMMPVVLLVFTYIIYLSFYFHDKSILYSVLVDSTMIQKQQLRAQQPIEKTDLEQNIQKQLSKKLLFFKLKNLDIVITSKQITIKAVIEKNKLKILEKSQMRLEKPEDNIRTVNRIEGVKNKINNKD